ncbi:MAG TPA: hypothetical protein VL856_06220 [Acidimicrobiia bacterium]|jgi:hypothetical protein|nr:hypothetical protein [Acidimicrobiia bacterium]
MRIKSFGVIALVAGVLCAFSGTAHAANVVTEHNHDSFPQEDVCDANISGTITVDEYFAIKTHGNPSVGYQLDNFRVTQHYVNNDTGKTYDIIQAGLFKDVKITPNSDGTYTFVSAQTGNRRVYGPDGTMLFHDRGNVRFSAVFDTMGTPDQSDDEIVEDFGIVSLHGHWPTLDRDFCDDLLTFTS